MTELSINVTDLESGEIKNVDTSGYLLLYLERDKIKMMGKMNLKTLAPMLTKIALEKLANEVR